METLEDSQGVYNTLASGKLENIRKLFHLIPDTPLKGAAEALLSSDNQLNVLMAFGMLLPSLSNGVNAKAGEVLGLALYNVAKDYFNRQKVKQLLLTSLSGFAFNYVTALNTLSKYSEVLSFVEQEMTFWESYEKNPENLVDHDYKSFLDNFKSIKITLVNALIQLNKIDEAENLAANSELEGNWASDIELERLRGIIRSKKTAVYEIRSEKQTKEERALKEKESQNTILKALEELAKSSGYSGSLVEQIKEVSRDELDPTTKSGFDRLDEILSMGEEMLAKGSLENNEVTLRQRIRKASGIFVGPQPDRAEILRSLESLKSALNDATRMQNIPLVNDALYGIYLCYSRLQRSSEAADQLIQIRQNLENTRKGIDDPLQRGGVFQAFPYLFLATVEHLYNSSRFEDALDAIEGAKGRAITDATEKQLNLNTEDPELWHVAQRLYHFTKKEKFHYVSFHVDDECSYALMVTTNGKCIANKINVGKRRIQDLVRKRLNDPLAWYHSRHVNVIEELNPFVAWLSPLFASGILQDGDHICYSTDDLLYLFPLSYLLVDGKQLVERLSLSRIHSAAHLMKVLDQKKTAIASAIAVSVPARSDVPSNENAFLLIPNLLSSLIPSTKKLHGKKADAPLIMSECTGIELIQFTAHGVYVPFENPFPQSGLLVADNETLPELFADRYHRYAEDGQHLLNPKRLLKEDYRDNRFDGAHISLQCCVSGYSVEGIAGDAVGLEWSFLQKGARSLLSCFWNIEVESSNIFFAEFYNEWLGHSQSKATAFRNAMLKMKKIPQAENPDEYWWAGYELIGDWR